MSTLKVKICFSFLNKSTSFDIEFGLVFFSFFWNSVILVFFLFLLNILYHRIVHLFLILLYSTLVLPPSNSIRKSHLVKIILCSSSSY